MKKKRRKIGIVLALVFFSTALAVALPKLFQNSKAQTGNGVVISTMSIYKDMDYSFLKKFNFGGDYSGQSILTFNSAVELMESTNSLMKAGKYITTKGYYEAGDLGGATYKISEKKEGYGSIQLYNGLYANLQPDSYTSGGTKWVVLSVKQFGAKGDGIHEDQYCINDAIRFGDDYRKSYGFDRALIYLPEGEYKAADEVHGNASNFNLVGEGDKSVIFTDNDYKKDSSYSEPFFGCSNTENVFMGNFKLDAREVDIYKYMRQMCLYSCKNMYIYNVTYNVPQEAWSGEYYQDKQYTNLTIYNGNRNVTVDSCMLYQMSGTYRGANLGIMDFWRGGTENITIMNCELHDNARDEQIGFFSLTGDTTNSYIKNVDFINNTMYSYTTPYKEVHAWRTMCFTVGYNPNNLVDVNMSGNHFIAEVDSKFMTFGDVKNCVIENNVFEIILREGPGVYIFDSSNGDDDNVIIRNNEFYITSFGDTPQDISMSTGHLTFTGNRVVSDANVGKFVEAYGTYDNNEIIYLEGIASLGGASVNTNNRLKIYGERFLSYGGGRKGIFCDGATGDENSNITVSGNVIDDYTYVYDYKRNRTYEGLFGFSTCDTFTIKDNRYNCPNFAYIEPEETMFIGWYRNVTIDNLICTGNDLQGATGIFGNEAADVKNTCRAFTLDNSVERISSVEITRDGTPVTDITVMGNSVTLDKIVKLADGTKVTDREIDWISGVESIATVNNGVVTKKQNGDVYIYAASKDGSGVYGKVKSHFADAISSDIVLEAESFEMQPDHKHKVMYQVLPYDSVSQDLIWKSSNESIVTVTKDGMIYAHAVGTATVTCTTTDGSNISKSIKINVSPINVKLIVLNEKYGIHSAGDTMQLYAKSYIPETAVNKGIGKWESSDTSVATVDSNGFVTVKGPGVCSIYAYTTDFEYKTGYQIYSKANKVQNAKATATMNAAKITWDEMDHIYGYQVYRYDTASATWKSVAYLANPETTSYTDNNLTPNTEYKYYVVGFVTSWETGQRVLVEGTPSDICTVRTESSEVIQSITPSETHLSMPPGYPADLRLSYSPRNAENVKIDWVIDDTSICAMNFKTNETMAQLKGVSVGFTTLTVTSMDYKGVSATIPIGVTPNYYVKDVSLSTEYRDVYIKWKAIAEESEIDGYMISRAPGMQFLPVQYISLEDLKKSTYEDGTECYIFTDTGLEFGKGYRYMVTPYIEHEGYFYACAPSSMNNSITIADYVQVDSFAADEEYILNAGDTKTITVASGDSTVTHNLSWQSKDTSVVTVVKTGTYTANISGISAGITRLYIANTDGRYVAPKIVVLPAKVTNIVSQAEEGKITLKWDRVDGATGYRVYRYNQATRQWDKVKETTDLKYEDLNISEGMEYSYKIYAYIGDVQKIYEGVSSDEIKVATLGKPMVKLLAIEQPADVTGIPNGTDLDVAAMGLPTTVKITTEDTAISTASVVWNLQTLADGTTYDKTLNTQQTFAITGIVMLPENIEPNNVSLEVKIHVTVQGDNQCATPEFSLPEGEYTTNQILEMVNIPSEATIYYTLDGSDPTTSSTKYTTPIKMDGMEGQSVKYVVKAIAVQEGKEQSSIKKGTYTITISAEEEPEEEQQEPAEKPEEKPEKKPEEKPDTGTDKPVFDESDIVEKPSNNNSSNNSSSKPVATKPTTSKPATVIDNSSKTDTSVPKTPVLDQSDIVTDPKDKEEIEIDMDWLDPALISSENSNATESADIAETINQNDESKNTDKLDETVKIEENKKDKTNKLPLYAAAAAGTTAAAGGAGFYFLRFRKRKW